MDLSLRRVTGSLLLLLGVSFLTIGFSTGQLETVIDIVKRILEASVAGAPQTQANEPEVAATEAITIEEFSKLKETTEED